VLQRVPLSNFYAQSSMYWVLKTLVYFYSGFYLERISDSEYARDLDTQISVYGNFLSSCGALLAWKSKAGKSVTVNLLKLSTMPLWR
jgi:hypothetical protein